MGSLFLRCELERLVWLEGCFNSPEEKLSLVSPKLSCHFQVASTLDYFPYVLYTEVFYPRDFCIHTDQRTNISPARRAETRGCA